MSTPQATLHLPLKGIYFDQIRDGDKDEEYRLCTPYWEKRLVGRHYDNIILSRGYPKKTDQHLRLTRPYQGYTIKTLTHPHFGPDPVKVFAIWVG